MDYNRRKAIQYSSEGDIKCLKKIFKDIEDLSFLYSNIYIDSLFYSVRSCKINCVKYILSTNKANLDEIKTRDIGFSIIKKAKIKQSEKIKMLIFLHNNGLKLILVDAIVILINLNRMDKFKVYLSEFIKVPNFDIVNILEYAEILRGREEFATELKKILRNNKLDNLLA